MLISDKDFKTKKNIVRNKEKYFIIIKALIYPEDIIILNLIHLLIEFQYIKQNWQD